MKRRHPTFSEMELPSVRPGPGRKAQLSRRQEQGSSRVAEHPHVPRLGLTHSYFAQVGRVPKSVKVGCDI